MIEQLKRKDLAELLEIERNTFSNPWVKSQFEECLDKQGKNIYTAKSGKDIVGYAVFEYLLDEGHISNLAVKKEFQGQGIGRSLTEFILDEAHKRSIKQIWLEVRRSNEKAKSFYSKSGFKEVSRRKAYYSDPVEDALVLKLEI